MSITFSQSLGCRLIFLWWTYWFIHSPVIAASTWINNLIAELCCFFFLFSRNYHFLIFFLLHGLVGGFSKRSCQEVRKTWKLWVMWSQSHTVHSIRWWSGKINTHILYRPYTEHKLTRANTDDTLTISAAGNTMFLLLFFSYLFAVDWTEESYSMWIWPKSLLILTMGHMASCVLWLAFFLAFIYFV